MDALNIQEVDMAAVTLIRFRDIDQRERAERVRIASRRSSLEARKNRTPDESAELGRLLKIEDVLAKDPTELCDPLFVGVRDLFDANPGILGGILLNHEHGVLKGYLTAPYGNWTHNAVIRAALTIGLLIVDGTVAAPVAVIGARPTTDTPPKSDTPPTKDGKGGSSGAAQEAARPTYLIHPVPNAPENDALSIAFFTALGYAQSMHDRAVIMLPLLAQEGDPRGRDDAFPGSVDAAEFAAVMRELVRRGVTTEEQQPSRRLNQVLDHLQKVGETTPFTELGIDLPDLEADARDVVPDNIRLMGPMVVAAMFDELKAFQVIDKLVELSQHGMLTIGSGDAGRLLYTYWKDAPNRMSEAERKNFYAMTLGIPGGESGGMVNREFNDLWLRFVASVSSFVRQTEVDKLLRADLPGQISQQQVRKAARDLAVNLSLHGYGMAFYAALDLQDQIKTMIDLLSDKDILNAYGSRDMWQVIDQVATLELGGAKTSSRYRTLAKCGGIITAWLANNVAAITRQTGQILDIEDIRSANPRTAGPQATKFPTDYDLVNACELWLADTATSDVRIDEMAQPREAPVMTSRPVQIPAIARDMLDGAGVSMSLGFPDRRPARR
jgi:hypothetical protein